MLKIVDLSVNIDNKNILHNFNLDINKGEIHAIMGPNGIGKSTICKTIMGSEDYKITNGNIYFNGEDLENLQTNERALKGIYLVDQSPIEIPGVTNAEMLRRAISIKTGKNVPIFEFNKKMEASYSTQLYSSWYKWRNERRWKKKMRASTPLDARTKTNNPRWVR